MIGILGGTFNPVHIGHLRLAMEAAQALNLERVELTPCATPPHKPLAGLLPFALRADLLRAAVHGVPRLTVSTLEGELPAPSYTRNLIRAWTERHGAVPLFILGDEDFACIDLWKQGMELPGVADLLVVPRSGSGTDLFADTLARLWPDAPLRTVPNVPGCLCATLAKGRNCFFLPLPRLDISASRIREDWCAGRDVRFLMPDNALELMRCEREAFLRAWA